MADNLLAPGSGPGIVERAREIALAQPITKIVSTLEAIRDRTDSRPTLSTIDVPALVMVGAEDRLTPPAAAEEMAESIPDCDLVVLDRSAHLPPLEQPEEFQRVLLKFVTDIE